MCMHISTTEMCTLNLSLNNSLNHIAGRFGEFTVMIIWRGKEFGEYIYSAIIIIKFGFSLANHGTILISKFIKLS